MKGIFFKPEMIEAIVEKRKTVTRRVIKPQLEDYRDGYPDGYDCPPASMVKYKGKWIDDGDFINDYAHYQVGETVYIKEAWYLLGVYQVNHISFDEKANIRYPLDNSVVWANKPRTKLTDVPLKNGNRSPMMMPEWAARYFITILGNSAELLRLPLSPEEMKLEGEGAALPMLEKINGLWVFRYEFEYRGGLNE